MNHEQVVKILDSMNDYIYTGDRHTCPIYKGRECKAVRRAVDNKCIRGRNGNMLVSFEGVAVVVVARLLRKIKKK